MQLLPVIDIVAFCILFLVWFLVFAVLTTGKAVNGANETNEVNGLCCEKDDVIDVDSASDDEVATPQSVLAHLHKSLNRSKAHPRILFEKCD
jgi:hypothetical protein|tara:strand:- start:126 stop:401 length:276 start_codon:yes stop_codon:yes gene_type:complete